MSENTELSFESAIGLENKLKGKEPEDVWATIVKTVKDLTKPEKDGAKPSSWIFRALTNRKAEDELKGECSAEIKVKVHSTFDDACETGEVVKCRWAYEAWMLREFKRAAHHYQSHLPEKDDFLEWLALARHYEMPSRLVDFTYSFEVACYFAMSGKASKTAGCILAVNHSELKNKTEKMLADTMKSIVPRRRDFHNKHLFWKYAFDKEPLFVAPVNPGRKNRRLIAQHGLFLCPGKIDETFKKNLEGTFTLPSERKEHMRLIVLPAGIRHVVIRHLNKVNVTMATLYPELTGFAQSLRDLVLLEPPLTEERFMSELEISISRNPWF